MYLFIGRDTNLYYMFLTVYIQILFNVDKEEPCKMEYGHHLYCCNKKYFYGI